MKEPTKELRLFFFSQALADGLRTTMAVLLPSLIAFYFNLVELGMTISLGALCVSISDAPGPILHRRNTMLFCLAFVFVVVVVTAFTHWNIYLMGLEILVLSFFFSMFTVYGMRAAMVGNATLLAMVLTIDRPIEPSQVFIHGLLIIAGGLWYMLISLAAYHIKPYRPAQRILGESIRELSRFLYIKADFYNVGNNLDEAFKKLLAQQVVVSEKQDAVREILFKTRRIVNESTDEGRKLVLAFVDAVDLFENITASYYNYEVLREKYANTGILDLINSIAKRLGEDLDDIGISIYSNVAYTEKTDYDNLLLQLKNKIDSIESSELNESKFLLKKMLVNIRRIMQAQNDLVRYFRVGPPPGSNGNKESHSLFVTHQSLDPKILWSNLNLGSSAFRHALRVSIACIVGFAISKFIAYGYHSYWILMTIAFMLKPAYSLTRQRNVERVIGTLVGGMIGFILLFISLPSELLFAIMVVLMIATYSFQRIKYLVSVICMTPFLLILFHFLGSEFIGLLKERIFDTITGCAIALMAGYLLFPRWESQELKKHLHSMLEANANYLQRVLTILSGNSISITNYKLVRKEVYISSANLSAAFQRMLSEPKSKQKNINEIHQFVVLNHTVFSNVAAIASTILPRQPIKCSEVILRTARKTYYALLESLKKFEEPLPENLLAVIKECETPDPTTDDPALRQQLEFINKLTIDIQKTTEKIISSKTIQ